MRLDRLVVAPIVGRWLAVVAGAALVACQQPPAHLLVADAGPDGAAVDAGPTELRIVTEQLPVARYGAVYEAALEAVGGRPPLRWEIPRGVLPSGAWLQEGGTIVAPAIDEDGVFGFVARVTDAAGARDERAFVLVVDRALAIARTAMPRCYQGHSYNEPVGAVGGRPPYTFSLVGGALPDGLHLSDIGRVTGSATEDGNFSFRVEVTDLDGATATADVSLPVFGPIVALDRGGHDLEFCFARRTATLPVHASVEVERVRVAVRLLAADVSRMVLTLVSPAGTEVYLTAGGAGADGAIDTVFGEQTEPAESLDAFVGERSTGTWLLTLYDPRCPYPAELVEAAVILTPRGGPEESLVVRGWTASLEAGRPSLRVAGGGIDQSRLELTVERYGPGENGVPEGGGGDDEWLGTADAVWSTTADPAVATVDTTGLVLAGDQTGEGFVSWQVGEQGGSLPLMVLPPDWVP